MANGPDTLLRACLDRLTEMEDLAWQVPPENRARMERTTGPVSPVRQAIEQAYRSEQQVWSRLVKARTIAWRLLGEEECLILLDVQASSTDRTHQLRQRAEEQIAWSRWLIGVLCDAQARAASLSMESAAILD